MDLYASQETYQVGAHFEALEGFFMAPLDPRYTQIGFNLVSVQVCARIDKTALSKRIFLSARPLRIH